MKTDRKKLSAAEQSIKNITWLEYVGVGAGLVLHIDTSLFMIGQFFKDDAFDVGAELAAHYRKAIARHGQAVENPAQLELFLTFKRQPPITVFLATVNGNIYFSDKQLCPF